MTRGPSTTSGLRCMGSQTRVLIGEPLEPGLLSPETAARTVRCFLERFDARLSRFKPDSELSGLNRDPRRVVPASSLVRDVVRAAALGGGTDRWPRRPDPGR